MVQCGIICTIGLVTRLAASLVQCATLSEQKSDDKPANFLRTSPDTVPEDDVATVMHKLSKRSCSSTGCEYNAFGKKINDYLQPSDGILAGAKTPVWLAYTESNGTIVYKRMHEDIVKTVVDLFNSTIDVSKFIANHAKNENASYEKMMHDLEREIWNDMFPGSRLRRELETPKSRRSVLKFRDRARLESTSSMSENDKLKNLETQIRESQTLYETDDSKSNDSKSNHSKSNHSRPDIIYPTILVVTHFKQSKTTENDLVYYDDIIYQLAFWNAVDLRFRQVNDPKIRLRIAGIIIGHDREANPYVNQYMVGHELVLRRNFLGPHRYWSTMRERSYFPFEAYDIIATATESGYQLTAEYKLPVYEELIPNIYLSFYYYSIALNGVRNGGTFPIGGLAIRMKVCQRSKKSAYPYLIIRDKRGFEGVITAAHELAHLFGLEHDESTGDECDKSHRYIMQATKSEGPQKLQWSPCSLKKFTHVLRQDKMACFHEPAEFYPPGEKVRRILPGDVTDNINKLCRYRGYVRACVRSPDMCPTMGCYATNWKGIPMLWLCEDTGPAPDGITCRPGHKCIDGVCQCLTYECLYN